jgi:hypothetical protein
MAKGSGTAVGGLLLQADKEASACVPTPKEQLSYQLFLCFAVHSLCMQLGKAVSTTSL